MRKNIGFIELIIVISVIVLIVKGMAYKKPDATQSFTIKATPVSNTKKTNLTPYPDKMSRHDKELSIIYKYHDDCKKQFGADKARQKTVDWLNNKMPSSPVPAGVQKASINTTGSIVITFYDGLNVTYCNASYDHDQRVEELSKYLREKIKPENSGKQIQDK